MRTIFLLVDILFSLQGGSEKQIFELCKNIDKNRYRIIVGCLSHKNNLLNDIKHLGITAMRFNVQRIYTPLGIIRGLMFSQFLKRQKIDILMTYHFGSDIWGTIFGRLAGVPAIISNRRDEGFWKKWHHNAAYKFVNRFVNKIIVVSDAVKQSVIKTEQVNKEKIFVIRNGIDLTRFKTVQTRSTIKEELGIQKGDFVIGCVGNLKNVKGQEYLIRAIPLVKQKILNVKCLFIGGEFAKEAKEIKKLVKDYNVENSCLFLGIKQDIPELLSAIDLCILPSLSEGLSNTLLEYMAAGKPIIATGVGGNSELIQDAKNGVLVKPADAVELAKKIIFLFENRDEMAKFGYKAKEDVERIFSIEKMIKKYETLFEELIKTPINSDNGRGINTDGETPINTDKKEAIPAVVLGLSANGLSIARSLGRKGIPVIGIASSKKEVGLYSKFLKQSFVFPNPIYEEKEFLEKLISLEKRLNQKAVLFADSDEYVLFISKYRDELSLYFNFLLPHQEIVKRLLDKKESYELANNYKIPCPQTYFVRSSADLEKISQEINYPCIIKPRFSHLWKEKHSEEKVFIINSKDELYRKFQAINPVRNFREVFESSRKLPEAVTPAAERRGIISNGINKNYSEVLIQEIISGQDRNVYEFMAYCDRDSNVLAYFTCRKLRQYPPNFGIGCLSESIYQPKIIELGLQFLKKLKYKGLVHIEFKINDKTGKPVYLETNLRTSFIGELSIASGIDLPYIAYRDITQMNADREAKINTDNGTQMNADNGTRMNTDEEIQINTDKYAPICIFKEGVKLLNLELYLGSIVRSFKNRELNIFRELKSLRTKKMIYSYFAFDDVKPFLKVYMRFAKTLLRKINPILFNTNFHELKTELPQIIRGNSFEIRVNSCLKVAHLISSNGLYGAEKVMLDLAGSMNYNGFKSFVAAVNNSYNPHLEVIRAAEKNNLPAYIIESKGRFDLKTVSLLCDFIRDNKIDIIHTHNYKANLLGLLACKRRNIPIIATLHGYINRGAKLKLYEAIDRFILRYFDKVILVDESLKKWFKNDRVKYEVINNGVDIEESQSHKVTKSQVKDSLEIKEGDLVIGTVGRLSEEKGHRYLLEAFSKIAKMYPQARLLIVGDGELRKELTDLSVSLGIGDAADFVGFQSDTSRWYQLMDIYVSPSLIEHFPLSILEAMSFAKPIIATSVGGVPRLIKNEFTGLLIKSGSSDDIYQAILRYIKEPYLKDTVSKNALAFVRDNYSKDKMINCYRDIYVKVLS